MEWTREKIATYTDNQIKSLRENAIRLGHQEVAEICDAELISRKPIKLRKQASPVESRAGHYVSEFHFVCPNELGVRKNSDGTFWTGTWVVAGENAAAAAKYSSLVALHVSKAEPSYLQGTVKDWRRSPRENKYSGDQEARTPFGIDFLLVPSESPVEWSGDGAGEKGYVWKPIP